jgi:hypothetical protein
MERNSKRKTRKMDTKNKATVDRLLLTSDQLVWEALKSMKEQGLLGVEQPKLADIDAEIALLGNKALGVKTVSKALRRLEKKGWIRRPLDLLGPLEVVA